VSEARIGRLQRKLAQRDRRIAGMQRRIADLEHSLATKDMEVKRLPIDVTRAVQEALCNVRMAGRRSLRFALLRRRANERR
jgi:hypothetical protein